MNSKVSETIREMTFNALLAALYVVFTLVVSPIAFNAIQFRLSELFVLFCFFNKRYTIGLTLGCLIANIFSPLGVLDIAFGTSATLLACIGIMFCKHLVVAIWFPIVINATLVAAELYILGEPYWWSFMWVAIGEFAVMVVAYIVFFILRKNQAFFRAIRATQNTEFKF